MKSYQININPKTRIHPMFNSIQQDRHRIGWENLRRKPIHWAVDIPDCFIPDQHPIYTGILRPTSSPKIINMSPGFFGPHSTRFNPRFNLRFIKINGLCFFSGKAERRKPRGSSICSRTQWRNPTCAAPASAVQGPSSIARWPRCDVSKGGRTWWLKSLPTEKRVIHR